MSKVELPAEVILNTDLDGGNVFGYTRGQMHVAILAEREACAKACENEIDSWGGHEYDLACNDCAKAIRSRGDS